MKQCPDCKTVYADDMQSFCLSDGAMLFSLPDEEETRIVSPGRNQMKINVPAETLPAFTPPVISQQSIPPQQQQQKNTNSSLIGILIGLLALVILSFAVFVAYIFVRPGDSKNTNVAKSSPSPTGSQTSDDETTKLKEQLANLEKKIDDQKNQKTATPIPSVTKQNPSGNTARVNSPSDGFLALRSDPNSETGYRITKIPHGTDVDIVSCQGYSESVGTRRGRWCQVNYNGQIGWVFDAFLIY